MKLYLSIMCILLVLLAGCSTSKESDPAELQTPQYSVEKPLQIEEPSSEEIHTADQGVKVISAVNDADIKQDVQLTLVAASLTPETVWSEDSVVTYNAFTMPEKAAFDDGSIGVLSIGKIGLSVKVYESADQMEDMFKGAAHFKSTSAWDGNVALSAHNVSVAGSGAYFKDLHQLVSGDKLFYKTALGEREYVVTAVKTINDDDWSALNRSTDNRLTLITCVNNNGSKRLLVQAVQK